MRTARGFARIKNTCKAQGSHDVSPRRAITRQTSNPLVPIAYKPFPELTRDSGRIAQENEIDRQVQAIRRGGSVGLLDAFEEGFYWLISAAVLAYLALGIFCR